MCVEDRILDLPLDVVHPVYEYQHHTFIVWCHKATCSTTLVDSLDPFLMPGDAIACYDSRWTNLREAIGMVSEAVSTATPAILLDGAL